MADSNVVKAFNNLIKYARSDQHFFRLRKGHQTSLCQLTTKTDPFILVEDYRDSLPPKKASNTQNVLPYPGFEMLGEAKIVTSPAERQCGDEYLPVLNTNSSTISYGVIHNNYVGADVPINDPTADLPVQFARRLDLELRYLKTHLAFIKRYKAPEKKLPMQKRPIVSFNLMPHLLDLNTWRHVWGHQSEEEVRAKIDKIVEPLFQGYIERLKKVVQPLCQEIKNLGGIPVVEITEGLPIENGADNTWQNIVKIVAAVAGKGKTGIAIDDQLSPKTDMLRQIDILTAASECKFRPVIVKIAHEVIFTLVHDHQKQNHTPEPPMLWPVAFRVLGDFAVVSGTGISLKRDIFKADDDFILIFEGGRGDYRVKNDNHADQYRSAIASVKTYRNGFWPNRVFVQGEPAQGG